MDVDDGIFSSFPNNPDVPVLAGPEGAAVVADPNGLNGDVVSWFAPKPVNPEVGAREGTVLPKRLGTGDAGFTPFVCSLSGLRPSSLDKV